MKKIFYLKEDPLFIQSFETADEPIVWIYRLAGKPIYSYALDELIAKFYNSN